MNYILNVFAKATPDQAVDGMSWYERANRFALSLSSDVSAAAGVIAALSPLLSWDRNQILAREAFAMGAAHGCLSSSVRKADEILAGADPLSVLGGDKVRSFYLNICDPTDTMPVTVDRHAYDVAVGQRCEDNKRPKIKGRAYVALADQYRAAAAELGMVPNQVQAVTWSVWRDTYAWAKVEKVNPALATV